jgi:hypothetical protein
MSAANTLSEFKAAAKTVLQCLKGLPQQADVKIALIGGLALWNYLPQYRSTTVSTDDFSKQRMVASCLTSEKDAEFIITGREYLIRPSSHSEY